jgi:hypothetical protein
LESSVHQAPEGSLLLRHNGEDEVRDMPVGGNGASDNGQVVEGSWASEFHGDVAGSEAGTLGEEGSLVGDSLHGGGTDDTVSYITVCVYTMG